MTHIPEPTLDNPIDTLELFRRIIDNTLNMEDTILGEKIQNLGALVRIIERGDRFSMNSLRALINEISLLEFDERDILGQDIRSCMEVIKTKVDLDTQSSQEA